MKVYVKAAKAISKSYDNVNEVFETLFGFDYSRYKKESDWFESDKFGTVKYQLGNAMSSQNSAYRIAVLFGGDDAQDNFYKFIRFCNENHIHISKQYPEGDHDSYHKWDRNIPQVNLKISKANLYTPEEAEAIKDIVSKYIPKPFEIKYWDYIRYSFRPNVVPDAVCDEIESQFNNAKCIKDGDYNLIVKFK